LNLSALQRYPAMKIALSEADGVDIATRSSEGAAPLAKGETPRIITSGDLMRTFSHHAKAEA
jgi:hypothetical protein